MSFCVAFWSLWFESWTFQQTSSFSPLQTSSSKKKFIEILIWAFEAFWRNPRFFGKKIRITLRPPLELSFKEKKIRKSVDFCQIIVRSIQLLRLRVNCWYVLNLGLAQSPLFQIVMFSQNRQSDFSFTYPKIICFDFT